MFFPVARHVMMRLPSKLAGGRMYESTQDAAWVHGIDLAQEADFDLGLLRVRPATCEVEWNGVAQTLQRRVMQVLVALARARGSVVSQDDLVQSCWHGLSVSDDAIYRCISQLRKLAASYPDPPYAIEVISGVGYRLMSSRSVENGSAVEAAGRGARRSRLGVLAAVAALATLIVLGAIFWIGHRSAPDGRNSLRVAVKAFDTLSTSDDARSLARRIPNEIVNELGDTQIDVALAGEQAGKVTPNPASPAPGLIVTGLLRDDPPNVIVDVRVEDGTTHAALWSMEFKRERRESSDLPIEVAARVADVVNIAIFARTANPPLTDDSALSALLQANDMIRDARAVDWAQMIERGQGVVARHPEFAFGHDVLAVAYAEAAEKADGPDRAQAMKEAARREANLTLKLDPEDAGAYAVLASIEPIYDFRAQEVILLRGIKFAKHPKQPLGALYSYEAKLLGNVGRLREALSFQLIARATDEWGAPKTAQLARAYANIGNMPAARSWLQKGVQLWPNHSGVQRVRRYIVGFYERPADALATINLMGARTPSDANETEIWRTFLEAKAAHSTRAPAAIIQKIRAAAGRGEITPENASTMLAALGETRQAIKAANFALDHEQPILEPMFLFAPITRNVRQDPGFVRLAARLGLIKYWRETGKWPDFCTDPATRGECSPQLRAALKSN
jgi:DNA-binding winged helix-turn-helix (wHTH) protein/TolB-like protein